MSAFDVTYTAIVISHSGRMMFVGTSVGTIRAMKYPLPLQKEFNEYQAHAGPVTKVRGTISLGFSPRFSSREIHLVLSAVYLLYPFSLPASFLSPYLLIQPSFQ